MPGGAEAGAAAAAAGSGDSGPDSGPDSGSDSESSHGTPTPPSFGTPSSARPAKRRRKGKPASKPGAKQVSAVVRELLRLFWVVPKGIASGSRGGATPMASALALQWLLRPEVMKLLPDDCFPAGLRTPGQVMEALLAEGHDGHLGRLLPQPAEKARPSVEAIDDGSVYLLSRRVGTSQKKPVLVGVQFSDMSVFDKTSTRSASWFRVLRTATFRELDDLPRLGAGQEAARNDPQVCGARHPAGV